MSPEFLIFDRSLLSQKRSNSINNLSEADFLIKRSLDDILEKLNEINRDFSLVLNLGSRTGYGSNELRARVGTKIVIESDLSFDLLKANPVKFKIITSEESLAFASNKFDLIVSVLNLHSINDLPGCLLQLKNCLKPNGVLIASMFGERNLFELRETLIKTDIECFGGLSPRIMPSVELKQLGGLLQRAGFTMQVVDKEKVQVQYSTPISLLHDLQNMGETNILFNRNKRYVGKAFWQKFSDHYITDFGDGDGSVIASFEILNLTAVK